MSLIDSAIASTPEGTLAFGASYNLLQIGLGQYQRDVSDGHVTSISFSGTPALLQLHLCDHAQVELAPHWLSTVLCEVIGEPIKRLA